MWPKRKAKLDMDDAQKIQIASILGISRDELEHLPLATVVAMLSDSIKAQKGKDAYTFDLFGKPGSSLAAKTPPVTKQAAWNQAKEQSFSEWYLAQNANDPKGAVDPEPDYTFSLEGEFQGSWYIASNINLANGESPIAIVVEAVFGLDEGDELVSVLVRRKGGQMEVRSVKRG